MTRVLVTGFEPFGGSPVNPSQELVDALDGDVAKALLPVRYSRAADELRRAIREAAPDVVICFGQADGRTGISVERFAHNLDEASTTDNDAAPGTGVAIDPDGPLAYASTLPVDAIVAALHAQGVPAGTSRDAGGFLCNHVFYVLMRVLEQERPGARGGFVHVPLLPEQALDKAAASMPLELLVRAGTRYRRDVRAAQIHELTARPRVVEEAGTGRVTVEAVALNPLDIAVGNGLFYGGHPPLRTHRAARRSVATRTARSSISSATDTGSRNRAFSPSRSTSPPIFRCSFPVTSTRRLQRLRASPV